MSLTCKNVQQRIDDKVVLAGISFAFAPGEIVGLVGRNGVGKTTLMRTITGQYRLTQGSLTVDEQELAQHPEGRADVFFLDTDAVFFKRERLVAIGNIFALAYPKFDRGVYTMLLQTHALADQRFNQLSKGYQALVKVALAIASQAAYVLLDEPFDGLDVIVRKQIVDLVIDMVATGDRGVMIASHDLVELDGLADRVLMLKGTHLVEDVQLEALRATAVKLQLVFPAKGLPAVVHERGRILNVQGRVATVLFTDYTPAIQEALAAAKPVLQEQLPVRLVDLFVSELGRGGGHGSN